MATRFLREFTETLLGRLLGDGLIVVVPGQEEAVITFVAEALAEAKPHSSLSSNLARALLACPDVEELFLDDDGLNTLVNDLRGP